MTQKPYLPGERQAIAEYPYPVERTVSYGGPSSCDDQKFKADAGKAMPDLLEMGFPRALRIVQATLEYGAEKYKPHSWQGVPDALNRYNRAGRRHRQERDLEATPTENFYAICEACDEESGLPHIAHEIFNLLAMIELDLQSTQNPNKVMKDILAAAKKPPQGHKA